MTGACQFGHGVGGFTINLIHSKPSLHCARIIVDLIITTMHTSSSFFLVTYHGPHGPRSGRGIRIEGTSLVVGEHQRMSSLPDLRSQERANARWFDLATVAASRRPGGGDGDVKLRAECDEKGAARWWPSAGIWRPR